MAFQKQYVDENKWMDVSEDVFMLDIEDYFIDTELVRQTLIDASPKPIVRTYWAFYRFIEDDPPEFPVYVGWDGKEHGEF